MFGSRLIRTMHSSYQEWKKKRAGLTDTSTPAAGGAGTNSMRPSSRVARAPSMSENGPTTGILSFNQMKRMEMGATYRPPSEVGTVRSVRSVMTVEEQVTGLEKRIDEIAQDQQKTQMLLAEILSRLDKGTKPSRVDGSSKA